MKWPLALGCAVMLVPARATAQGLIEATRLEASLETDALNPADWSTNRHRAALSAGTTFGDLGLFGAVSALGVALFSGFAAMQRTRPSRTGAYVANSSSDRSG